MDKQNNRNQTHDLLDWSLKFFINKLIAKKGIHNITISILNIKTERRILV